MELTINNLIKIVIAVIVIVLVVTGLYFAMRNYVIPYFKGFGFELVFSLVKKLTYKII